jgi:hypothetical protein
MYESAGTHWYYLGLLLLVIMGAAVFTVRHDPLAISAIFVAIAGILRAVPSIIDARNRPICGRNFSNVGPAPSTGSGDPRREAS